MTDAEFMREVKKLPKRAYLFCGEENYTKALCFKRLESVHDDPSGFNHDRLAMPDARGVMEACETLPLMAEKRLVMVMDAKLLWSEAESRQLAEYLPKMPETATLALWCGEADKRTLLYKAFAKLEGVVECGARNEMQAAEFAMKRAQDMGCECPRSVAMLLVEMVGTGLSDIVTELEKLCSFELNSPLSEKALRLCVQPRLEYRIFDMLDAFLQGRMDRAMVTLSKMLMDTHPLQIIAFMDGRLRLMSIGLRAMEAGKKESEAVAVMGGSAYAAKKLLAMRRRMPRKACEAAIIKLADLDYAIKTGKENEQTGLQRVLMEIFK